MPNKWWGWGDESKTAHVPDPKRFWSFLRDRLGQTEPSPHLESLEQIRLRPPRLEGSALEALRAAGAPLHTDDPARAVHSLGKSYCDLVRIRRGDIPNPTDAVASPGTEAQLASLLQTAARLGVAVVPFGGGTSVVGGLEPAADRPTVTLSLAKMARVLRIDSVSARAEAEAGIIGPALEASLNAAGFTLGHFPQSFEQSSLGGWIATRSAGQNSTRYGKIEERVESLRMVYPGGDITTAAVPAAAAGPDLNQVVAGSEGILGIITRATVRLARLPAASDYRAFLLPSFSEGLEVARHLLQAGLEPGVLRLSDEPETESTLAMRGASLADRAFLVLGFEGSEAETRFGWQEAEPVLERHGAQALGTSPAEAWRRGRFEAPYLRDYLMDGGVMVDTLETATTWDRYPAVYRAVREAIAGALDGRGIVMAHLSHVYTDGGSIYYTFLAPARRGTEVEQWRQIKDAATDAVIGSGGALSHHHAIGTEHRRWMGQYAGPGGRQALAALKAAFDPAGIMNPGKLIPEES